jgi:hypothetical protein
MGAARVDGVELIGEAVDRLRERYPDSSFTLGDVADPSLALRPEPYDR